MSNVNIDTTVSGKMLESWLNQRKKLKQTMAVLDELAQDFVETLKELEKLEKAPDLGQMMQIFIIKKRQGVIRLHFNLMDTEQERCLTEIEKLEDILFNEKLTKDA